MANTTIILGNIQDLKYAPNRHSQDFKPVPPNTETFKVDLNTFSRSMGADYLYWSQAVGKRSNTPQISTLI